MAGCADGPSAASRSTMIGETSLVGDHPWRAHGPLRVSENARFLVHRDGAPFFWLGDTAWELFHRLNREEADRYLRDRAEKGFTVIQAVALAEIDGLNSPNGYGHRPLLDNDPTRPDVREGAEDYWDHVDYVLDRAESLGLTVALLPSWGDKWDKKWGVGPEVFTLENAFVYARWLGRRYRERPLVWIVGGDRDPETDAARELIRAFARGLREGDGGAHLITMHPQGGRGSAEWFHAEPWLDFNARQNGHEVNFNGRYELTRADYERTPPKPVLDLEPVYEDHPVAHKGAEFGYATAADVRRAAYWNLFSGAFGHTYGHHAIWQMAAPGRAPLGGPLHTWEEALNRPGARQMRHARALLESRPFLSRIPDDSMILPAARRGAVPGAGIRRMVATRDREGRYAMVYGPAGYTFKLRLDWLAPECRRAVAWWFNPRTGEASRAGEFDRVAERSFTPPTEGELLDWVLVIDDAAAGFPPPGASGRAAAR